MKLISSHIVGAMMLTAIVWFALMFFCVLLLCIALYGELYSQNSCILSEYQLILYMLL